MLARRSGEEAEDVKMQIVVARHGAETRGQIQAELETHAYIRARRLAAQQSPLLNK